MHKTHGIFLFSISLIDENLSFYRGTNVIRIPHGKDAYLPLGQILQQYKNTQFLRLGDESQKRGFN
jgi:hypothetical protein